MSIEAANRIVIKIGSSSLTHGGGKPNLLRMEQLTRVISELKNCGKEVILVSSGAIAAGRGRLNITNKPQDTPTKQALAAIGQCELMGIYDRIFSEYGYFAAQILINRDIIESAARRENVINTFNKLIEMGAVPIVNENDSVSVEEILFGDNDNLSAIVANLVNADLLIILTDIDGYFDKDPHKSSDAKLIPVVHKITDEMINSSGDTVSTVGTGGMRTKLEAAKFATEKGINVVVMSGENPANIYELLDGKAIGTVFLKE